MTVNFSDIYRTANKIFLHASEGQVFPAVHYISRFYEQADKIKDPKSGEQMHTAAKMALQQAYVDTLEVIADDYAEGVIDNEIFREKNKNISLTAIQMQNSKEMLDIDSKIKKLHRETGAKRLAIIPNLMDSYINGLGMVKHSAGFEKTETLLYKIASSVVLKMNPAIVSLENEIVENKGMKKILYFMHKLSFR